MYVNRAWLIAAEPRIYNTVTLGPQWKQLLSKLGQRSHRGRLIQTLNVYDIHAVEDIVEIVELCPRLERLRFACRAGIPELARSHTGSTVDNSILQVTVHTIDADATAFVHAIARSTRAMRLELDASITSLAALPADSLAPFDAIGIYLSDDDTFESDDAFEHAASLVAHVTKLDIHVDVALPDAHCFLQALEPNDILHLTMSSEHSPLALPAWTLPISNNGKRRLIEYVVPPVEDDYEGLNLTPTKRTSTNIFGLYRGGGDLCIRSSTHKPTLFHRRLLSQAHQRGDLDAFDRVYFLKS